MAHKPLFIRNNRKRGEIFCLFNELKLIAIVIAVFCLIFTLVNTASAAYWTEPDSLSPPPDPNNDQSPINLSQARQTKTGRLTVSGLETNYWIDVDVVGSTSADYTSQVVNGTTYVANDLIITDDPANPATLFVDSDNYRVLVRDELGEDIKDGYELQNRGRIFFETQDVTSDTVQVSTSGDTAAFHANATRHEYGIFAYNTRGVDADPLGWPSSIKGIGGDATDNPSEKNTFGIMGLAGARTENDSGIPYAGMMRGMVNFAQPDIDDTQPFYLNSDVLVENLNVDYVFNKTTKEWLSCNNPVTDCDFVLDEEVAAAFVQAQTVSNPSLQSGGLQLSGQAQFDQGIVVNGLQIAKAGSTGSGVYVQGPESNQQTDSIGLYAKAGSGTGYDLAAYLAGPVHIENPANPVFSTNSRSVVTNLNADKLAGYQSTDFLKLSDLNESATKLDDIFIRRQTTYPGFSQPGQINLNGTSQLVGSLMVPRALVTAQAAEGSIVAYGGEITANYAIYAEAGPSPWAAQFDGQVKIIDHNLFIDYLAKQESADWAGTATITAGSNSTEIASANYNQEKSKIFTTVNSVNNNQEFSLLVTKNSDNFQISLYPQNQVADQPIKFSYFIINQE